eukprot:scaffold662544_cov92-Prasinocladus_malaysianus.AAC.1
MNACHKANERADWALARFCITGRRGLPRLLWGGGRFAEGWQGGLLGLLHHHHPRPGAPGGGLRHLHLLRQRHPCDKQQAVVSAKGSRQNLRRVKYAQTVQMILRDAERTLISAGIHRDNEDVFVVA